ncbi:MAG: hypothetical protein U0270_30105 [Labilithrix sp.]
MRRLALRGALVLMVACSDDSTSSSSSGNPTSGSSGSSGSDTCSGGQNMTSPVISGPVAPDGDGTRVRITWERGTGRGADLPAKYFDAPVASPAAQVDRVEHVSERELDVVLKGAPAAQAGKTLAIALDFGDRRTVLDCKHPGMQDHYVLELTLTFGSDGSLAASKLEEKFSPGDI